MGNPVVHFEIMGQDSQKLRAFYGDTFGWDFGEPVDASFAGHVTFYVEVADVARVLETIEKRGGTKVMGPAAVPGGPIIGLFRDPEGRAIGLAQRIAA